MVLSMTLAGVVSELHVADELVDAEVVVVLHLLEAAFGVTDDDHVAARRSLDRDVALDERLQERERRFLLGRDRGAGAPTRG